jgi:hypothetical protein
MAIRDSDGFGNRTIKICIIVSNPDVSHLMLQLERVRLSTKDMDGTNNVAYAVAKDEPNDSDSDDDHDDDVNDNPTPNAKG